MKLPLFPWRRRQAAWTPARTYSLLLLGHTTFSGTLSLERASDCWQQATIAFDHALRRVPGIDYAFRRCDDCECRKRRVYDGLPRADVVAFVGLSRKWLCYERERLTRATGCRATVTIGTTSFEEASDWSFAFAEGGGRTTWVDGPVWRELYSNQPKIPGSVLLDHWTQSSSYDWTDRIEAWLEPVATEFTCSRYVQDENGDDDPDREARIRSYLHKLARAPFRQWLADTDRVETFVMTHVESYGFAILDMFARGIRVLCPAPLLPPHFKPFHIDTFNDGDELISLLRTRTDARKLDENRARLTGWDDIARMVDTKCRELLVCAS
jgi:hypothetical protein